MTHPDDYPVELREKDAAELRARAAERGWVLATRCQHCGAPLWDITSVAAHAGPTCRARHKTSDPAGTLAKESTSRAATTIPTA